MTVQVNESAAHSMINLWADNLIILDFGFQSLHQILLHSNCCVTCSDQKKEITKIVSRFLFSFFYERAFQFIMSIFYDNSLLSDQYINQFLI